jgi:hypothetical protein
VAGRRVCGSSSGARRRRALRSHRVLRKPADTRDRRAHGARRTAQLRIQACHAAGGMAHSSRARNRAGLLRGSIFADTKAVVRRAGLGRDHSHLRGGLARAGIDSCQLPARGARSLGLR